MGHETCTLRSAVSLFRFSDVFMPGPVGSHEQFSGAVAQARIDVTMIRLYNKVKTSEDGGWGLRGIGALLVARWILFYEMQNINILGSI